MAKPLVLMVVVGVLLTGCTGGPRTTATSPGDSALSTPAPAPAPRIAPTEVADALDALSTQTQQQAQAAADEMEPLIPGTTLLGERCAGASAWPRSAPKHVGQLAHVTATAEQWTREQRWQHLLQAIFAGPFGATKPTIG